jgi:hypothetical protein
MPITVRALTDGKVVIDGQSVHEPVRLLDNDYFVLEGFDAHSSNKSVIKIGKGSDKVAVRRVCAWDAADSNFFAFEASGNQNVLFEDVCGFGIARKIFDSSNGTIFRRAWGRWEASTAGGPKTVFQLGYNDSDAVCENCIATWETRQRVVNQPTSLFRAGASQGMDGNVQYLGSIGYLLSDAGVPPRVGLMFHSAIYRAFFRDIVLYTQLKVKPLQVRNTTIPCTSCRLINITEIGGIASQIGSDWTTTNRISVATVDATPNIWNGAKSNGARICKRYVNGTLTDIPLWPWPMNRRIIDAMKAAGKSPVDVTRTMEKLFGPIPSECRGGASTLTESNSSTMDDASRSDLVVPDPPTKLHIQ